jgi:hypothetical protein
MANRALIEQLASSNIVDVEVKGTLEQFYGPKWYKCTKAACYYFHEGFFEEKARDYHTVRHEHPFRCKYVDCEAGYKLGFTNAKQLEKHLSVHHPRCRKIMAIFTTLIKERTPGKDSSKQGTDISRPPGKFLCHICSKSYTRKEKLNNHL